MARHTPKLARLRQVVVSSYGPLIIAALLLVSFSQTNFSQASCSGEEVLSKSSCSGDEISSPEREIVRLVNEYRVNNKRSKLPISEALSLVANRHVQDIKKNLGFITHSWSDCAYRPEDSNSWNCIFNAPKRFDPTFTGVGFENVYFTTFSQVDPRSALDAWKRSPSHNATMLNLDNFAEFSWESVGIAIDGKYAAIWFASKKLGTTPGAQAKKKKGLGVTFDEAIKGLSSVVSINNVSSSIDSKKWVGTSKDKSIVLEMFGKTREIAEGNMALRLRVEKRRALSAKNQNVLNTFIGNLAPKWTGRHVWVQKSLRNLRKSPSGVQKIVTQGVLIELTQHKGFVSLVVKPSEKPKVYEVK